MPRMRAVVQRVKEAWVEVDEKRVAQIGLGLLVLLGVEKGDGPKDKRWLAKKVAGLRIFEDENGKLNLSLKDLGGEVLVVSNFTLCGDCRKGRRPSFDQASPPEEARTLYEEFCQALENEGLKVQKGVFRAHMYVGLVNNGPVTLLLDSRKRF